MSILRANTLTNLAGVPYGFGSGTFEFISGTRLLFHQASAPPGWVQITTHDDKALRVVSGTSGGTASIGGSPFTSVFASTTVSGTVGDTTLALNQIPSHQHLSTIGYTGTYGAANGGGAGFGGAGGGPRDYSAAAGGNPDGSTSPHTHGFTGTTIDFAVQYIDVILCSKN